MNSGKEHQDRYRYYCKEITQTKRGLLNMIIVKFSCQVICEAQLTVYVYSESRHSPVLLLVWLSAQSCRDRRHRWETLKTRTEVQNWHFGRKYIIFFGLITQ